MGRRLNCRFDFLRPVHMTEAFSVLAYLNAALSTDADYSVDRSPMSTLLMRRQFDGMTCSPVLRP